jgi:alpha-D-ribose 1-methylphosphonate 5-triphosphate synthase subunit PhnH
MKSVVESSFDKVFDTQRIFRSLLDVMSHPGTLKPVMSPPLLPPEGFSPHTAAIAFTLLDEAVTFGMIPRNEAWERYMQLNTGAHGEEVCQADYLILQGAEVWHEVERFCRGSLTSPEKSSTLIVNVETLTETGCGERELVLRGPGIEEVAYVGLTGLHLQNIQAIRELNTEFPLGVDVILVDAKGMVCALPRSVRIELEGAC